MSPRAAWRLETLGFEQVHDYVGGKAEWLANGLPREGIAGVPYAGELVDRDPPTCALTDSAEEVRARLAPERYGFCLVLNEQRILLGRVRRSALDGADAAASAESLMEPGPSTVRFNTPARDLAQTLTSENRKTAIVTTPGGCLVGVFHREEAERHLAKQTGR
jgi:Mg/Co/Ni transporter MgtE